MLRARSAAVTTPRIHIAACAGVTDGTAVLTESNHLLFGSGNARYNALSNL